MNKKEEIPSFYTQSRVNTKYSFSNIDNDITDYLRKENILTDYDSTSYIRIMKYVQSTSTKIDDEAISNAWKNDNQNEFYVRCYLPKSKISAIKRNERIKRLIIMFNGLDEILNYDLYDALGNQLATQGYSSILLPTPYHLNRRIINGDESTKSKTRYYVPTKYATDEKTMMYYYNFEKSINELQDLINSLKINNRRDYGFFHSLFDFDNLKITLFGFSLGGLKALSSFLMLKPNFPEIHSCVTWNSGPGLEDINVESIKVDPIEWSETMKTVKNGIDSLLEKAPPYRREYLRLCKWIYFSKSASEEPKEEEFDDLRERLGRLSTNYLSIQSASDKTVSVNSFDRILPSTGLHRLIVPGVDHVPGQDIKWGNWVSKICENIIHFIKGCGEDHYNRLTLEKEIEDIIIETEYFNNLLNNKSITNFDFTIEEFSKLLTSIKTSSLNNAGQKALKFEELYYISKAFYPKFPELLSRLVSRRKRKSIIQK